MPDLTPLQWTIFLVGVFCAAKAISLQYALKALRSPQISWQKRFRALWLLNLEEYSDREAAAKLIRQSRTWLLLLAASAYLWKGTR